ncbi:MAG: low-specificity L-threonine aldolase [Chloroflexi bacterium]|nr:low-specificity L-threonine aldolase [Chloroflexota bacterium]
MYNSFATHDSPANIIDLRSDTVTHPTPAMRRVMADAEVGDDVYGEDPTINKLERLAAEMLGKEAAVFVASGTMANVSAMMCHVQRGDEVILGARSHMYLEEQGAIAALGQAQAVPIMENPDGTLPLEAVEAAIRDDDPHHPITRLVCLENTHNICGGQPISVEYTQAIGALAKKHGLKFHIDGARLFNAAVALNVSPAALAGPADSISFCLSKGLCAPVGSMVCGSGDFIARVRRARKVLGGGMRQAGILAAAGLVALTTMVERLSNDHDDAQRLAQGLAKISGIVLDPAQVRTNMVYFDLAPEAPMNAQQFADKLKERGALIGPAGPRRLRAVLHYWISPVQVDETIEAVKEVLK